MKGKIYIGIKGIVFCVLLCTVLARCNFVLAVKDEKSRISAFYEEEKDSLDAVFIGSSHMFVTAYPYQLWEEYGIKSAVLGGNGMGIPMEYYCVKEAIREQHPDVIVVELYKAYLDRKLDNVSYTHNMAGAVPYSINKLQMLGDLIPEENRAEFCFPLYLYHSRWKELKQEDFEEQSCYTKGAAPQFHVYDASAFSEVPQEEKRETPKTALKYIDKMIKECKQNDVELIFTVIPYETTEKTRYQQEIFNGLADILAKREVEYYNFFHLMDETGINVKTDFYDDAHVNYEGGRKITSYFGKVLSEKGLGRKNKEDRDWDEGIKAWNSQIRNKQIKTIRDKKEYLDFLESGDYEFVVMVKKADMFGKFLKEKNLKCDVKLPDDGKCIIAYDKGEANVYSAEGERAETDFNGMWLQTVKDKGGGVMLDKERWEYTEDIKIFVYDEVLSQIVDVAGIDYSQEEIAR